MPLLLELIRQLLEYLGIPAERLVPIWESYTNRHSFARALGTHLPFLLGRNVQVLRGWEHKEYGCTRSMVRVIGTLLPLDPCPRPHFQHVLGAGAVESTLHGAVCRPGIPSLADVTWLTDDHSTSYTRFRPDLAANKSGELKTLAMPGEGNPGWVPTFPGSRASHEGHLPVTDNAIQKIAALEDDLMQLRAQIAAIVAIQETKSVHSCSDTLCLFGSPSNALPPPSLASTPLSALLHQSVAPTPPPPPAPPPPIASARLDSRKSAIDLIKLRKAAHKHSPKERETVEKDDESKLLSMMDVLKDMTKIRLRAVERSPGGTPITRKDKKRRSLNDPAAIIAHALKQKFAHTRNNNSFDKENKSSEESSFSSPETPQFGRHLLKPSGKRPQVDLKRKQVLVTIGPNV
ncbi:hypothetical protein FKM82_010853 [Ascaphus truei]